MPPPCSSYAMGAVTNEGMETDLIDASSFVLGGQLRAYLTGTAPSGCQPYRMEAEFFIDWQMTFYNDGTAGVYPEREGGQDVFAAYSLGRVGGTGGISNGQSYTAYSEYCHIYKTGTSDPIDFQAIFNSLYGGSGATLAVVTYIPRAELYLGNGTPFSAEVHETFPASIFYLPA